MTLLDEAHRYINHGLSITPVQGKIPFLDDWVTLSAEEIDENIWNQGTGFGLVCGKSSGIICLDIDRIQTDKVDEIYDELQKLLPPIRCGRIGNPHKPPARFFRYNGEESRKFIHLGIEILSDGNQVVLPPSKHPDFGYYKWVDDSLADVDVDDLPVLDTKIINFLDDLNSKLKLEKKKLEPGKNRCAHGSHNYLSKMLVAMISKGKPKEEIVKELLAYDRKINAESDFLYFECPTRKEWKRSKDTKANAEKFVDEAFERHADELASEEKKNKNKYESFKPFLNAVLDAPCIDKIRKWPTHFIEGKPEHLMNYVGVLKSMAVDFGLPDSKVQQHVERYCTELDEKLTIDIAQWDGVDRVCKIFDFIEFENLKSHEACELFKEWAGLVFQRADNPHIQNRFLIFKGNQGLGKDTLIKSLLGGLKHYFTETTINKNPSENYQVMSDHLIINVAEFDQTAKFEVSFLKDMVTKASATFRAPYARGPETREFKCSFISTCNVDDILRDHTGNRRYQIFDIENIDWDYQELVDREQLLAQYVWLGQNKYRASGEIWAKMKAYISDLTPDDPDDAIIESYLEKVKKELPPIITAHGFTYPQIEDVVTRIANNHKQTPRQIQRLLRRRKYSKKIGGIVFYSAQKF